MRMVRSTWTDPIQQNSSIQDYHDPYEMLKVLNKKCCETQSVGFFITHEGGKELARVGGGRGGWVLLKRITKCCRIVSHNWHFSLFLTGVFSPPNGGELRMQQSGLPHHSAVRNEHHMYGPGGVTPERGMILPFQPLSIAFSEISYYVDMPAVCC